MSRQGTAPVRAQVINLVAAIAEFEWLRYEAERRVEIGREIVAEYASFGETLSADRLEDLIEDRIEMIDRGFSGSHGFEEQLAIIGYC